MSIFGKLFGGGGGAAPREVEPVEYNGFHIYPEPMKEGGTYRIAARIEKEMDGEVRTHRLIRADTLESAEAAADASLAKAKSLIDQQGETLFG